MSARMGSYDDGSHRWNTARRGRVHVSVYGSHRLHKCCHRCTRAGREGIAAADWHHDWAAAVAVGFTLWWAAFFVVANVILAGS